ncbi:maf protein [Leptothrix cholodnii SP-6]|uniref:dTTP/UTP pyrophosphatase n=1 Tax=Leptothrix cholodnii (strain ATCC 51168 / LMG 8142 / SP-6) TaxID=395495 RepID=B1Y0V6_LEPCP|nr:Maf family protein [Leptothrix cholodnii]ACB34214.1 maf protein [Leptothrix cholodnii SP-6]
MPRPDWIYLASQSPRRAQLLTQIGVPHQLLLPGADEDAEAIEAVIGNEAPATYVQRVTRAKLDAARRRLKASGLPAAPILCADTTVAIGRRILGKPQDAGQAHEMLASLAGREHRVLTAVAVGTARRTEQALHVSKVRFVPLSQRQIADYVASGEPMGKAGAYAIQSAAAAWIAHISGSHSGIMGLPLHETATLLQAFGWKI